MIEPSQLQQSKKNIQGHIFWGQFNSTLQVTFHVKIKRNRHIPKIKNYGTLWKGHGKDLGSFTQM